MCENSRQRVIYISNAAAAIFLALPVAGAVVGGQPFFSRIEDIAQVELEGRTKTS
jgi:hypothetical protein